MITEGPNETTATMAVTHQGGIQWRRKQGTSKWHACTFISARSVRAVKAKIRALTHRTSQQDLGYVLTRLNMVMRGWASYYRTVVSKHVFTSLDSYMWWLAFKWAVRTHRNKPRNWVTARYLGAFNKARRDNWVFGDRQPAPISPSSPGRGSSGTRWSTASRHPMTRI